MFYMYCISNCVIIDDIFFLANLGGRLLRRLLRHGGILHWRFSQALPAPDFPGTEDQEQGQRQEIHWEETREWGVRGLLIQHSQLLYSLKVTAHLGYSDICCQILRLPQHGKLCNHVTIIFSQLQRDIVTTQNLSQPQQWKNFTITSL